MKQLDPEIIAQIRDHAVHHPESNYIQIAEIFKVSLISVKRYCKVLAARRSGRGVARLAPSTHKGFGPK